jgi:hypothetical protein
VGHFNFVLTASNCTPLLVVGLLGCNAVFGLDPRSFAGGPDAVAGSGSTSQAVNQDGDATDSATSAEQGPTLGDATGAADTTDATSSTEDVTSSEGATSTEDATITDSAVADAQDASSPAQDVTEEPDSSPCMPITTGLLAHWTMDDAPISGTRLTDTSGNGNNGALVGFPTPATVPGKFGQALSYSRSGAYVNIPTLALDQSAGAVNSVSFWYYRSNTTTINDVLMFMPANPQYAVWLVQWMTNELFLCFNTGFADCFGVQDSVGAQTSTLHDRWIHVVAMFSNGPTVQSALYIDGKNAEPVCQNVAGFQPCNQQRTAAAPVILGGNSMYPFRGWLDEVRIYNRALTASEVTALYNGTACP